MGEPEAYDEVMLDTHRYKWKELIVDMHEFCRSVADGKPIKSYFTLSSFGPLAGRGVCWAIVHVPYKLDNVLLTSYSNILIMTILTKFLMQEVNKTQHNYKATTGMLAVITLRIGAPVKNGL